MGNVVLWDQFKITSKRTNHNMFILGTAGMGKSFTMKKNNKLPYQDGA